jgi:hypothetical protein
MKIKGLLISVAFIIVVIAVTFRVQALRNIVMPPAAA